MIDFIPRQDSAVLAFTRGFAEGIDADPQAYHVSREVADEYVALQAAFAEAYGETTGRERGSVAATARKNTARAELVKLTRRLARLVHCQPDIEPGQLAALGLRPHKTNHSRIGPPVTKPVIQVLSVCSNVFQLKLTDNVHRTRPANAVAAMIYWTLDGRDGVPGHWLVIEPLSSPRCHVRLPETLPEGTRVGIRACWVNARFEHGPMGPIVETRIGLRIPRTNDVAGLTAVSRVA